VGEVVRPRIYFDDEDQFLVCADIGSIQKWSYVTSTTATKYLNRMVSSLQLTDAAMATVTAHIERVKRIIRGCLATQGVIVSGSFYRNTCISPLHDVDLICVLDPIYYANWEVGDRPEKRSSSLLFILMITDAH
jgi:hypothetical protein